jgi:capsular polysaccharide biosynthesis protein
MNIENKRQLAIILFAVGLGLGASIIMSKVVNDKIENQTRLIAGEYQKRNQVLVQEIDSTKKMLNKLAQDHAALVRQVAERPIVKAPAPVEKPKIQQMAFSLRTPPGKRSRCKLIRCPLLAV